MLYVYCCCCCCFGGLVVVFEESLIGIGIGMALTSRVCVGYRDPAAMLSLLKLSWSMYSEAILQDADRTPSNIGESKVLASQQHLKVHASSSASICHHECPPYSHSDVVGLVLLSHRRTSASSTRHSPRPTPPCLKTRRSASWTTHGQFSESCLQCGVATGSWLSSCRL